MAVFFTAMAAALVLFRRSSVARGQKPAGGVADFLPAATQEVDLLDRSQPTAVFLIGGRNELAPFALRKFADQYSSSYRQILFLAVGPADAPGPGGGLEASGGLRATLRHSLDPYLSVARGLGLKVDCRVSTGTDVASGVARQADWMVRAYPRSMFFVGKLVFGNARWYHRILHSGTADAIRDSLERRGIPVTVLPIVLPEGGPAPADRN